MSAAIGVGITKLFKMLKNFESLRWLAGGLGCGLSSAAMTLTNTHHPPAGATALLASIDPQVEQLGWYLLPLVLLSTTLILVTSLLVNNIQRQYPVYWWTPADFSKGRKGSDIEKVSPGSQDSQESGPGYVEDAINMTIQVTPERIIVPDNFSLAPEEKNMLEAFRDRLRQGMPNQS